MFIGQTRLVRELNLLFKEIDNGANHNILLSAPSGFGKTTLALSFMNDLGLWQGNIAQPPDFTLDLSKRIQFMDEIHQLPVPEIIYQYLDSGRYTFLLATNETGILKEPLINRCIVLQFAEYTDEEAGQIVRQYLGDMPQEIVDVIIEITSKIPRQIKVICTRLDYIFRTYGVPQNSTRFFTLLEEIMDLDSRGYSAMQRHYLEYLEEIGGIASINTITSGLRIDRATILREIEPRLLYDKKITISSKGRKLLDGT